MFAQSTKTPDASTVVYSEPTTAFAVSVSDDGKLVALLRVKTLSSSELVVVDVESGKATRLYPKGDDVAQVAEVSFSADGTLLVATDGGREQSLLLRLDRSGRELARASLTPSTGRVELPHHVAARRGRCRRGQRR